MSSAAARLAEIRAHRTLGMSEVRTGHAAALGTGAAAAAAVDAAVSATLRQLPHEVTDLDQPTVGRRPVASDDDFEGRNWLR